MGVPHPSNFKGETETFSCTLVFEVIPENTTFQRQIFNLGLKTNAISEGNFPFDSP